ncbi:MAG: 50S ribosomal protein L4 [Bdellovibrionales bacterium]|nr:50S ribosomal protein L4 [Bdellovibrionales bacterium]
MAKVSVIDWNNKKVGEVNLPDDVFGAEVRKDILHTIVKWQLAKRRQGTHSVKRKGEVSGGGKKPFKQKGTGNARQGSSRSPLMPGGGSAVGPKPRSYAYDLPKKVKQLGLRSALSYLAKEGKLFVIDEMNSSKGKTKEIASGLKTLGLKKAVLLDSAENELFKRAARNLDNARYYSVDGLNVYDLLKYDSAVITKGSVEKIAARCGSGS